MDLVEGVSCHFVWRQLMSQLCSWGSKAQGHSNQWSWGSDLELSDFTPVCISLHPSETRWTLSGTERGQLR